MSSKVPLSGGGTDCQQLSDCTMDYVHCIKLVRKPSEGSESDRRRLDLCYARNSAVVHHSKTMILLSLCVRGGSLPKLAEAGDFLFDRMM